MALAGCAPQSPPPSAPTGSQDSCRLLTDSAGQLDTFTIGLAEPVDLSHAPEPTNESERLLFRELFGTLVRVDCQGKVQPGLATSWAPDSMGTEWTFVLRQDTHFWDGSPLTATSVISDWRARWAALQEIGLDSLAVLDETRLLVRVQDLRDPLPQLFANPKLSVTPPLRAPAPISRITFSGGPNSPLFEAEVSATGDLRDALDGGADLALTRDPALLEYAASRQELQTFPLPWNRTYALLQRVGAVPLPLPIEERSFRTSLARDAVRADARPSQAAPWWNGVCTAQSSTHSFLPAEPRVVYSRSDVVARQLAERIIALAGDSLQLRAVGMESTEFAAALRAGKDRGYIVALPLRPLSPCHEAIVWTTGNRLEPLIDTRARVVIRRGAPALTLDWDGIPRIGDGKW